MFELLSGMVHHYSIVIYFLFSKIRVLYYKVNPFIMIDWSANIEKGAILSTHYGGNIIIGKNTHLYQRSFLCTYGGDIQIGHNCSINAEAVVYGLGGVKIGNNVLIAGQTMIVPGMHTFKEIEKPICKQPLTKQGIVIEDDVWIGSGVKILDGVTVSRGCVIGAGAVVNKSTEPYGVYVGVPAKKIKSRVSLETNESFS